MAALFLSASPAAALDIRGLETCLDAQNGVRTCAPAEVGVKPHPARLDAPKGKSGPGWAITAGLLAGVNGLDWHTTRQRLAEGNAQEIGPLARVVGNDARWVAATALETGAVQLLRAKGKPEAAWGLLVGCLAAHLIVAGCNASGCW